MFSKKTILDRTRGGLDILLLLADLPSTTIIKKNTKVRFRHGQDSDKSGAITMKQNGEWYAIDFGDDSKQRDAISMYMHVKKVDDFKTALEQIALLFHIPSEDATIIERKSDFRSRLAKGKEKAGEMSFELKAEFSEAEIKTIFAESLIYDCKRKAIEADSSKEPDFKTTYKPLLEVLKKFKCHSLISYTIIKEKEKEGKTTLYAYTICSNENYPIFLFDYGTWKIIYQPFSEEKGLRFFHYNRPKELKDHIYNLNENINYYNKLNEAKEKDEDLDDADKTEKSKVEKLDHIIICSGQRDALNVAAMGYHVVWRNSESEELSNKQYWSLKRICKDIYNLPDIDNAGVKSSDKMSMAFLDIRTILLPDELKGKSDPRFKKPCKDIRDYLKYWNQNDFKKVFASSYPFQFWDELITYSNKKKTVSHEVNNVHLYNFIEKMGFYRFKPDPESDDFIFIKITDNKVKRINPNSIKTFINEFLENRNISVPIRNMFYRSPQLTENSLANLKFANPDFDDFDKDHQYFNFNNEVWKIGKDTITAQTSKDSDKFIWTDEIIKHDVEILPDMFVVTFDQEKNKYAISINNKDCPFFRFLINTSRVHWKEEVSFHFTDGKQDSHYRKQKKKEVNIYLEEHNFDIASPLLSKEMQENQELHLINKMFCIGYTLHRYRNQTKSWLIWAMDIKERRVSESHGGSGKSLPFSKALKHISKKYIPVKGRKPKLTEDEHIYGGVTKRTGYLLIEDAHKNLDIAYFFDDVTDSMTTNPKHKDKQIISPEYTPKIIVTSNFQPHNLDPSKRRRILFYACSDWYHHSDDTKNDEYLSNRHPIDDIGMELFTNAYSKEDWNLFYNFCAQCIKVYLTFPKINPPMDQVNKINDMSQMGDNFKDWADLYFFETDDHGVFTKLNSSEMADNREINPNLLFRNSLQNEYWSEYKPRYQTPQSFKSSLISWCKVNGFSLNPDDIPVPKGVTVKKEGN